MLELPLTPAHLSRGFGGHYRAVCFGLGIEGDFVVWLSLAVRQSFGLGKATRQLNQINATSLACAILICQILQALKFSARFCQHGSAYLWLCANQLIAFH